MKKLILNSSIATLALMTMGAANAQSTGTVSFTGSIRHNTCSLRADSVNQTVALGSVSPSAFSGGSAGNKPFQINLDSCTIGPAPGGSNYPATALVRFHGSNVDTNTGNLKLSPAVAGTTNATGVQVRIKNDGGVPMLLDKATAQTQNSTSITLANGANTLNFSAEYVATGGISSIVPGAANTTVDFEMVYP